MLTRQTIIRLIQAQILQVQVLLLLLAAKVIDNKMMVPREVVLTEEKATLGEVEICLTFSKV